MPRGRGTGPARSRERERLAREAAAVALPRETGVCVLGGGAAGLAAAVAAAEAGARVTVLERSLSCGRTILATGNGRCNLANEALGPEAYNRPGFVAPTLGDDPLGDVLSFFGGCGLAWTSMEGRVYPRSLSAASVRSVLLDRARSAGATLACGREAEAVRRDGDGLSVAVGEGALGRAGTARLRARAVVVATGGALTGARGAAGPLAGLGLASVAPRPALCPLACEVPDEMRALDGCRARCEVTLSRGGTELARERGEVLFRPYGVSGVVVFDLSRTALPGDELSLDLAPELDGCRLAGLARATTDPGRALDGALDPRVAHAVRALASRAGDASPEGLARVAKGLRLRVTGTADESHAQVTRGGLDVAGFDGRTLASHDVAGLFACGEALDVDGACGGFNLAWAWLSGLAAGRAAARCATGAEGACEEGGRPC